MGNCTPAGRPDGAKFAGFSAIGFGVPSTWTLMRPLSASNAFVIAPIRPLSSGFESKPQTQTLKPSEKVLASSAVYVSSSSLSDIACELGAASACSAASADVAAAAAAILRTVKRRISRTRVPKNATGRGAWTEFRPRRAERPGRLTRHAHRDVLLLLGPCYPGKGIAFFRNDARFGYCRSVPQAFKNKYNRKLKWTRPSAAPPGRR